MFSFRTEKWLSIKKVTINHRKCQNTWAADIAAAAASATEVLPHHIPRSSFGAILWLYAPFSSDALPTSHLSSSDVAPTTNPPLKIAPLSLQRCCRCASSQACHLRRCTSPTLPNNCDIRPSPPDANCSQVSALCFALGTLNRVLCLSKGLGFWGFV